MSTFIVWADGRAETCGAVAEATATARAAARSGARVGVDAGPRAAAIGAAAAPGTALVSARAAALMEEDTELVDLGLHRLADLAPPERLFALEAPHDASTAVPGSLGSGAASLPVFRTSFVERTAAIAHVDRLLGARRLVTLTGPGGSGKTRLAAHVAAREANRRPDGVAWIELGAVADPKRVAELAVEVTGTLVDGVVGTLRSLVVGLAERRMLLCLDNCEHLVEAAAELAEAVLAGCPEVTLLLTSREPLGVPGEEVWRVPALDDEEAFALFVARGAEVRSDFAPDAAEESTVRMLCARLDGIPLALELAAAWVRTLSPEQIEAGLDDRFALLTRGPRGAVARQATLAASMDWSHDLLAEPERVVLRRLSVFAGTFDADDACAVCADDDHAPSAVLTALGRLVDQSLVANGDRPGRLRLLESVREYAAARLREAGDEETARTRDRHLGRLLAVVRNAAPLLDQNRDAWRERLGGRIDDLRTALDWGLAADDPATGRELAAELPWLWHVTGHGHEGIATLGRAIGCAPHERSLLQARLLVGVALVADTADPLDLEYDAAQRALTLATDHGDDRLRALCLLLSGVGLLYSDLKGSRAAADAAAALGQATGDAFVAHAAVVLQGILMQLKDRHDEADTLLASGIAGLLALGERGVASTALGVRSASALLRGDLTAARTLAEQAVEVATPLAEAHRVGAARSALAVACLAGGDREAARASLTPVVKLLDRGGNALFVPGLARARGLLALADGDALEALRWLASEARSPAGVPDTYLVVAVLPALAAAQAALGRADDASATAARALASARAADMPRAVAEALEQQAWLAVDAGDLDAAIALHQQALGVRVEHELRGPAVDSLEALAVLSSLTDRPDMAVRVLAAAARAREASGLVGSSAGLGLRHAALAAAEARAADTLEPDELAAAAAAGAALSLDEAIAYVRRTWGPRHRPASGWASLTPTEAAVVRLAIDGRSNPEIGAKLFMSRSTVKTHLSHVFSKVGVANRTELAATAPQDLRTTTG